MAKKKAKVTKRRVSRPVALKKPVLKNKDSVEVLFGNVEKIKIQLLNAMNRNLATVIALLSKIAEK